MTAPIDRARLRALAEANGNLGALIRGVTRSQVLALLDALDVAERERDEAAHREAATREVRDDAVRLTERLGAERDALAADARRWRAIEAYWRTAQCYFRKDEKNSIRAMQLHIDFDHPNGHKSLASTIDAALDGAKGAT